MHHIFELLGNVLDKKVKAKDFDDAFDRGDDVIKHLDKSKARRVNEDLRRVNIDFPAWVISSLD